MTLSITEKRTVAFCRYILNMVEARVGFADVGSGGTLKRPWSNLAGELIDFFDFEPTQGKGNDLPICVSDSVGEGDFYIAHDERASSFHVPSPAFVKRFNQKAMLPKKTIRVRRVTLDEVFRDKLEAVDAVDINVEGHDLAVLRGSERLLNEGVIKLIKIEFELATAWEGNGFFSDIEILMRGHGFQLANIEIDYARPSNVAHFYNRGEPVWGKGYFVPSAEKWQNYLKPQKQRCMQVAKGLALYVAAGLPGRAFDLIEMTDGDFAYVPAAALKAQIEHAFAWSKIERGLDLLTGLASGAWRTSGSRA